MFLVGFTTVSIRVGQLQRAVNALSEGLPSELERQNALANLLESNQRTSTAQLQEVRRLLNLPTANYRFAETETAAGRAPEDPSTAFYRAVDHLLFHYQRRDLQRDLRHLFSEDPAIRRVLDEFVLTALPGRESGTWRITGNTTLPALFTIRTAGSGPPAHVLVQPFEGEPRRINYTGDREALFANLLDELESRTADLVTQAARYESVRTRLMAAIESPAVQRAVSARRLIVERNEEAYPATVLLQTRDEREVLTAEIRPEGMQIRIDGEPLPDDAEEDLAAYFASRIVELDLRPADVRAEDDAINRVVEIAQDPAFVDYLAEVGLRLSLTPRETLDFYAFDLSDRAGDTVGSFAVLKKSAELYLLDEEDVVITGLQTLIRSVDALQDRVVSSSADAQVLPDGFPPGFRSTASRDGTDLLLVGTHETQADAIMLLHLSPDRSVSIISIPRDIYYQRRKLSHHYEVYGARSFVERVSEITGRNIDGFIAIDMYAFIEVVDILGGVTITLDEPLIDPTYRVRDDGEWGTLHYPAGTHTLNGIEALRVARSRHTTTDFGRSARQKEILEALRQRINALHAGNLDRVYQLLRTLYDYVETDLGAWELTQFFLAYRNAPITNRAAMTFDNVLYSTYSNVHHRGITMDEAEEIEDFFFGQWILLPRNDDWDVIPWFVEQNLN